MATELDTAPEGGELAATKMPDDKVHALVSRAERSLRFYRDFGRPCPKSAQLGIDAVAHILWLQDENERLKEERDSVTDHLANVDAGHRAAARRMRAELAECQRNGARLEREIATFANTVDRLRAVLGCKPAEDVVVVAERMARRRETPQ